MDFEKKLGRLEEIVKNMESGAVTLEESLKLFEEGVKISRECQGQLETAEQKVRLLMGVDENGRPIDKEFRSEEA